MFCISCGKKIPDGMGFCPYCGAAQRGGGQANSAPASGPSPAPASGPAPSPAPSPASGPAHASATPATTALVPNVDDKRLGQIACVLSAVVVVLELAGLHQACQIIGVVAALWLLVNIVKK